jgi:hypothetical protein
MMEFRVRTKRSDEWVETYKGAQITNEMVTLLLRQEARVLRPDGKPLCVYLPGAVSDLAAEMFTDFSSIRLPSRNRGYASGGERAKYNEHTQTGVTAPIMSGILGSIEKSPRFPACRLTAFNAKEVEKWDRLQPMFKRISELFEKHVPDRFVAQDAEAQRTHADWVIEGTPFTTITINNTYPTGIHTDKGDLDEGFSTLATMRRGAYYGGWLTFPQYGVAVDMQDGDLLLMDAHDWHGNTPLACSACHELLRWPEHRCEGMEPGADAPERVSIVSYFRTNMTKCESRDEEQEKRQEVLQERNERKMGL